MLRSLNGITGYKIKAEDGEIGKVKEFYFDDRLWTIRYVIVDTGDWLVNRLVMISPVSIGQPDPEEKILPIGLTKKAVEESPGIDKKLPVSRQKELELLDYYKEWPNYWETMGAHVPETAIIIARSMEEKERIAEDADTSDSHLRSTDIVMKYNIEADDDSMGHVDDFILDDEDWKIRYLVVDTVNWLPWSKKVLIAPLWIKRIKWSEEKVFIGLSRDLIKDSPEYDPSEPINREYEIRLYDYYGRPQEKL